MFAYKIVNKATGRAYIGVTCRSLEIRFKEHLKAQSYNSLSRAIRASGRHAFSIILLAEASSLLELYAIERGLIAEHGTYWPRGYNRTSGGDGRTDSIISAETRLLISIGQKGKPKSPEHVEKVRRAITGKKRSPEQNKRNSAARLGKRQSPEAIAKTSAANRGRKQSLDTIARRVATRRALGNYKHTQEARVKMSVAHLGRAARQ